MLVFVGGVVRLMHYLVVTALTCGRQPDVIKNKVAKLIESLAAQTSVAVKSPEITGENSAARGIDALHWLSGGLVNT